MFDPYGASGATASTISKFDGGISTILFLGGMTSVAAGVGSTFELVGHFNSPVFYDAGNTVVAIPTGLQVSGTFRFTCVVTSVVDNGDTTGSLFFKTTGVGWMEVFANTSQTVSMTQGSGYDTGKLIARLTGLDANKPGNIDYGGTGTVSNLGSGYAGQNSMGVSGSIANMVLGTTTSEFDPSYFVNSSSASRLKMFGETFNLNFGGVYAAHRFTPNECSVGVGSINTSPQVVGGSGGIAATLGSVNAGYPSYGGPDFIVMSGGNMPIVQ